MHSKKIEFEKLFNTRDLCSIKNRDGFYIKEKKLIRGPRLDNASSNDLEKLYEEYEIRTIIDFRTSIEKYECKDPLYKDENYIDLVVQQESYAGVTMDEQSRLMKEYFDSLDEQMKDENFRIEHMAEFYYSLANDYTSKQYGKFIKQLIYNDKGTYWHCSLGRDRCGIGTALLLECLDVDRDTIIEDYLYTNECMSGFDLARKEYIDAYYKGIEDVYGSIDNLLKYMGIDDNKKQLLKDKYLEK